MGQGNPVGSVQEPGAITQTNPDGTPAFSGSVVQVADKTTPANKLAVDASGHIGVTGTFWQATQPVSGTVAVSNLPASQPVTIVDGGAVTIGAKADAADTTSTNSDTLMAFIKGLVKIFNDAWDSANHWLRVKTELPAAAPSDPIASPASVPFLANLNFIAKAGGTTPNWQPLQNVLSLGDGISGDGLGGSGIFVFNQSSGKWTRITGGADNADAEAPLSNAAIINVKGRLYGWNGTGWDRLQVDSSKRLQVKDTDLGSQGDAADTNVSNADSLIAFVKGLVKILADVWDSGNHRIKVDGSGVTQPVSGTFWQATQPVSGTVTANQGTAGAQKWLVDGSGVTQPVSGIFWQATQPVSGTVTSLPTFKTRTDNFTATGNGVTVDTSAQPTRSYSMQVTGVGSAALTWDVRLEVSLDNVNFTAVLQHTNTTGDKILLSSGAPLAPGLYFRSRVAGLTLGGATSINVVILGV